MCGLFGWSFSRQPKKATMKTLAVALMLQNDNRGGDSWGWFAPKSNSKRVGIGNIGGMRRSLLAHMISEPVVIGHTRKATKGTVVKQNCHPFDVGSIVGAHNGIVYNHDELNTKFNRNCSVDSEHIFYHLAENEDLTDIEAYGAVLMHSRSVPETPVFFGSFNDGELAYCRVDGGVIWSSAKRHLQIALQVSGLSAKIEETVDGILYSTVGTGNGVAKAGELDIGKPNYVSKTDWHSTGCGAPYRDWMNERDEDDEYGTYWDGSTGKFVTYKRAVESASSSAADEEIIDGDDDEVHLNELTEGDLEELAAQSESDTFSLIHLNEHLQEETPKPIKLIVPY